MKKPKKRVFDESQDQWFICGLVAMIASLAVIILWHLGNKDCPSESYTWIPGVVLFVGSWYAISKGIFPKW